MTIFIHFTRAYHPRNVPQSAIDLFMKGQEENQGFPDHESWHEAMLELIECDYWLTDKGIIFDKHQRKTSLKVRDT